VSWAPWSGTRFTDAIPALPRSKSGAASRTRWPAWTRPCRPAGRWCRW
jgi:hypothetical protein